MITKFHQLIQKGKLSIAIDLLLSEEELDENVIINLTLIKMKLSIIEQEKTGGRIKDVESELFLKSGLAHNLLKIYYQLRG